MGLHADRIACYVEGRGQRVLWLTEDEIRGGWKHWRPKPDPTPVPPWIVNRKYNDVVWGRSPAFLVSIGEIKRGWIRLSGLMQEPSLRVKTFLEDENGRESGIVQPFEWGVQRYDTFFAPLSEALPDLKPRFGRLSAWDHVASGGPV
jgi:hypothetical protein